MPLYEYECARHGSFEFQQSIKDDVAANRACPTCNELSPRLFSVPHLKTATTFLANQMELTGLEGGQFQNEKLREFYTREMKAKGESTSGKFYVSQLADHPGDHRAWVSDRDELKRKIEARGDTCPELGVKGREVEPSSTPLAADIRNRIASEYLKDIPKAKRTRKMVREAQERAVAEYGARKDSGPTGPVDHNLLARMKEAEKSLKAKSERKRAKGK